MFKAAQKTKGITVVARFMDNLAKIVHNTNPQNTKTMTDLFRKAVLKECSAEVKDLAEVLLVDFSKVGTLTGDELNEAADWASDHVAINMKTKSVVIVVAPLLPSSSVTNGEEGERRRIETKFRAKGFELNLVTLSGLLS